MKRTLMTAAFACSLVLAGPALAQESIYDQNYEYGSYEATTSGTVDSFRIVNLQGTQDEHVVVRVQPQTTGAGYEFAFVHLGSRNDLRNQGIRIYADQNLTAHGQMGRINGRPVLFAERVTLDDKAFTLGPAMRTYRDARTFPAERAPELEQRDYRDRQTARDYQERRMRTQEDYDEVWPYEERRTDGGMGEMPPSAEPFEGSYDRPRNYGEQPRREYTDYDRITRSYEGRETGEPYVIRGEVTSVRDFDIAGVSNAHRLIKIADTTRPGAETTYIVDLGPSDGPLADMELERGDRVMVQGHAARIEGRPVLHATQVAQVFAGDDEFASEPMLSSRLRRDSPEPSDSPSQRVGKPEHHDSPSRTSSDLRLW